MGEAAPCFFFLMAQNAHFNLCIAHLLTRLKNHLGNNSMIGERIEPKGCSQKKDLVSGSPSFQLGVHVYLYGGIGRKISSLD